MRGQLSRAKGRSIALVASVVTAGLLAGCASTPQPKSMVQKRSKEYFAESEYGVKASPRVSTKRSNLPRGGGRDQVGRPYKVKGKWYYPKEQPGYKKTGKASWYGDAFHGRLTANGEIYDMTHLTAAHPTMPLPSYARVTNLKNGSSVMVRVNDRGPYAHGRVIDLSKRAAEMLDYTHSGIADVRVEYVSRAPLEGLDDEYLMASYKPGGGAPDPSDGMPTGVMIAMAGPTPTVGFAPASAAAFPGVMQTSGQTTGAASSTSAYSTNGSMDFPEFGPVIADRPFMSAPAGAEVAYNGASVDVLSYAQERVSRAFAAIESVDRGKPGSTAAAAWKSGEAVEPTHIAVGTFDKETAEALSVRLSKFGKAAIEKSQDGGEAWYSLTLRTDGRTGIDQLLEQSWAAGAVDAFVVRQ